MEKGVKSGFTGIMLNEENIAAFCVDGEIVPCGGASIYGGEAKPILIDSREGRKMVRRTFAFVFCAAARRVFKDRLILAGQPVEDAFYWTFIDGARPSAEDFAKLEDALNSIIQENQPIHVKKIRVKEAAPVFRKQGMEDAAKSIENSGESAVEICEYGGFFEIYRNPLLERTGALPPFVLRPYHEGFLLITDCSKKEAYNKPPSKIFLEREKYKNWNEICGVRAARDLNAITTAGSRELGDFIQLNEVYADGFFSRAALKIHEKRNDVRIALLAGPSSSGKTTSAKRLCLHLRTLGLKPVIVSLDDYYLPPDKVPKDEDGRQDFERPEALDVDYLNGQVLDLLAGKKIVAPKFDFKTGTRREGAVIQLKKDSILLLEGIHALNNRIAEAAADDKKYKIYVSAFTQIRLDEHSRVPSGDNRLLRRIVRDNQFRGSSAGKTLEMWPSVQRGEKLHIFHFQNTADFIINSALEYEIGVLRLYAGPLLRTVPVDSPQRGEAVRLLRLLNNFSSISPQHVPGGSLLREFIGGGDFKY
ncbi:MAG: nucleoside kinase [Spirochaetaceae bacterium]|nr:nucleoside kinase [Spirochaetaceae bacterium]